MYAPSTPEHRARQVRQQQTQIYSYNYTPSPNAPRTSYQQTLWQQAQAQRSISNAWEQAKAIGQSVYDWGASRTREATNIARNWTKSLEETITHVCTTAERWVQSVTTNKTNIRVADFHKIEEANQYGLTVAEKTKIDTMSMTDLKAKYSSVIGNYNTYIGTGYFNPLANGENRAVIERYKILKAEEEAKIAAKAAEMNKYHYLNLYKTIAETGLRPNGTPATDLEKKIAPFVPLIPIVQAGAAAFAGYQYSKYSSSVPTGNGAKWGTENRKNSNPVDIGEVYGPQPANDPLAPLTVYGPQQHNDLLMPISTLDKLSPRQIANMSFDNIRKALPKGWELKSNNGFVHIYDDVSPNPIIRIDPPDSKTQYPHMHFYDRNKNSLDINGKIVDYRSPDAHVPWNNGQ